MRGSIEVADIFRAAGPAYRTTHARHLSLAQLKVMSAIETCRTVALGGHVEACEDCEHQRITYNSCRNRHCPKCQGAAARSWLAEREDDLLPVGYFHVVFTLPTEIADIAFQNKTALYDLLFRAASETLLTIAADPAWPNHSNDRAPSAQADRSGCAWWRGACRQACKPRRNHCGKPGDTPPRPSDQLVRHIERPRSQPALHQRKTQIPIAHRMRHAGSCMRGFHTPDGTRNPSPSRPLR